MAAFSGTAGSVTVGTVLVGGMSEWSLDVSGATVEDTEFGQTWDSFVTSTKTYTGSFSGNEQTSGTGFNTLRDSMLAGSVATLRLYENATKYYLCGTVILTGMSPALSAKGKGEVSFNFQGSGPVTYV